MAIGPNVTGWSELMNADVVGASFTMFDTALAGLLVAFLFLIFHIMLWYKTNNLGLCFVTSMIFVGVFFTSGLNNIVHPASYGIIFVVIAFELGGILYGVFFK